MSQIGPGLRWELQEIVQDYMEPMLAKLEERLTARSEKQHETAVCKDSPINRAALPAQMEFENGEQSISSDRQRVQPEPMQPMLVQTLSQNKAMRGAGWCVCAYTPLSTSDREHADPDEATGTRTTLAMALGADATHPNQFLNLLTLVCLLSSACADALAVDYQARHHSEEFPFWYNCWELALCICFVVELLVRMQRKGFARYFTHSRFWHYLQLCLVVAQVTDVTLNLRNWLFGKPLPIPLYQKQTLHLCRVFRIVRILHVLDNMDYAAELHILMTSMAASTKSLAWSLIFMIIPIFMFALVLTESVAEFRTSTDAELDAIRDIIHLYGTLGRSMRSLFWSISGGLTWNRAVLPLLAQGLDVPAALFFIYVASMVFATLNILTGVFVNSATEAANVEKEKAHVESLISFFKDVDTDKSGTVSLNEFQTQMESRELRTRLMALHIDETRAFELFDLLDEDGSQEVNVVEFVRGVKRYQGSLTAIDFKMFHNEFDRFRTEVQEFMKSMQIRAR